MISDNQHHWLPFPSRIQPEEKNKPGRGRPPGPPLDGFLAGPENRLAETAVHWVLEGIPNFADDGHSLPVSPKITKQVARSNSTSPFFDKKEKKEEIPLTQWPLTSSNKSVAFPAIIDYIPFANVPCLAPLVFYGPSGTGKTHLVQGLYSAYRESHSGEKGICLTGNDFYRSFTHSLEREESPEFRRFFESTRISVFEDIDTLENHPAGQEELSATLEYSLNARTLIVLTMKKHPEQFAGFSRQLVARLVGGLLVPVAYPGESSRRILIERILRSFGMKLQEPVIELLLKELPQGVGAMYGTLQQLSLHLDVKGKHLSLQKIEELLAARNPGPTVTIEDIAKKTARYFAVRLTDMRSKSRMKTIVLSRNIAIYLARTLTNMTLQDLGQWFNGRDHTTIRHGFIEIENRLKTDTEIQTAIRELYTALGVEQ